MKKNSKKILLTAFASVLLFTGCGKKNSKIVQIEGKTYYSSENEYVEINLEPRYFDVGEHIIYYNVVFKDSYYAENGWGGIDIDIPEVPVGYKYQGTVSIIKSLSIYVSACNQTNLVHVFVNEVPVEANATNYNPDTLEYEYNAPGVPVKRLILE